MNIRFSFPLLMVTLATTVVNNRVFARDPGWPGQDLKGHFCSGTPSNYGPFDYTNPQHRRDKLPVVERYHFTTAIQLLMEKRNHRGDDASNISYTLRAFPNHYLALESMMNLELIKGKKLQPPMICYFNRAIAFKPNDYMVWMLKGIYLRRKHLYKQSLEAFREAERLNPESTKLAYNIGLLLYDMKRYKKAAEYARKAYAKNYPLQGLRKKLRKKGLKV